MRYLMSGQRRTRSEGFTLIEMIVAVTLIAIMSLAIYGVLRISIASWKRGTESMDENQRHRATLDLVQKQLASVSAIIPALDLQLGVGQFPVFTGTDTAIQFITPCPLRFRDSPGLNFVAYEIVPGNDGEFSLIERETRYLGGDPTQDIAFDEVNDPVVTIFDHLASAAFEYFDPGDNQVGAQWVTSWNASESGQLPKAISLQMSSYDSKRVIQNRQIVIPLMAEPDNLQGFVDPFDGRRGGPALGGPPGSGRGGPGLEPGRGRGDGRGRGGPGDPGRGRGGPGVGPGGPGRGGGPGFDFGGRRGPGTTNPPPGGRRGGRIE